MRVRSLFSIAPCALAAWVLACGDEDDASGGTTAADAAVADGGDPTSQDAGAGPGDASAGDDAAPDGAEVASGGITGRIIVNGVDEPDFACTVGPGDATLDANIVSVGCAAGVGAARIAVRLSGFPAAAGTYAKSAGTPANGVELTTSTLSFVGTGTSTDDRAKYTTIVTAWSPATRRLAGGTNATLRTENGDVAGINVAFDVTFSP